MTDHSQNIKCGWKTCLQTFDSEIDMNMHVMMNHMIILEHGEFVLTRRAVNRKRQRVHSMERSVEISEAPEPNRSAETAALIYAIKQEPSQASTNVSRENPQNSEEARPAIRPTLSESSTILQRLPEVLETLRVPEASQLREIGRTEDTTSIFRKFARVPHNPVNSVSSGLHSISSSIQHNVFNNLNLGSYPIFVNEQIPPRSPANSANSRATPINREVESSDHSLQMGEMDIKDQLNQLLGVPPKLSDVIDEFLERLKPMKQLGFIRPQRSVYCVVCLKYVRSFHECNWKHTPGEDRVAEMWYRRFGKERPSGKHQLMKELDEIKQWILTEEEKGNLQEIY